MTLLREFDLANSGILSVGNSTTAILLSGETFTGVAELNNYPHVGVTVRASGDATMYFDFSVDGVNWDSTFPVAGFEVLAGISDFHTAIKLGRYFRIRFINNGVDQTYIRLATYYGNNFVPSMTPMNQAVTIDTDATMSRPTEFSDEVSIGRRSGVSNFNKFGYREGLTAASGEQTIWATTTNFVPMTTASTLTITYNAATDGLGTTGALVLYFSYINSDGITQIGIHTLGNTGSDVTTFTALGINRCAVSLSGSANHNTNDILITETTGGTTQGIVPAIQSTTQQAIFFTDSNSDAVTKFLWINVNKISGGGSPRVLIKAKVFNRQFETTYEVFRILIDTGVENTVSIIEPIGFALSPTDVLYFVADTDTNSTIATVRFSLREYKRS